MTYLVPFALRLAYGAHAGQRRRQVLVVTAAAVTTLVVLGLVGAASMLRGEQRLLQSRRIEIAEGGTPAALVAYPRYDTIDGRQLPVVWLEVRSEPAPLPPGMPELPPPGGWYVSPALAELAAHDPLVAHRFPDARTLGDAAVLNPAELLAYRRLPAAVAAGADGVPVARFGGPAATVTIGDAVDLAVRPIAMAAAGFAGVPLLLLLLAALTAAAPVRRHRLAVLDALGMPRPARAALVAAESAALAVPGVVIATTAYALLARRLTTLPLVGRSVSAGALAPSPPILALTAVAVVIACTMTGVLADRRAERGTRPRPSAAAPRLSAARWAPLGAGAFLLVLSLFRDGRSAATAALGGVLLVAVGTPFALPMLVRAMGARLAVSGGPTRLLAGRRLVADPLARTRPLLGLATILVVVPVAATWVGSARVTDPPVPSDPAVQTMRVTGTVASFDHAGLAAAVPGAVAFRAYAVDPEASRPPVLRLAARCTDLAPVLGADSCAGGVLTPAATERLTRVLRFGGVVEVVPGATGGDYSVTVLAPAGRAAESAVRAFALNGPAPLSVTSDADFVQRESPLVAWILAGMTITAILTFTALAVGLVDRTAADARTTRLLRALGLTRQSVRTVQRREFLVAYSAVVGTGLVAGTGCAWFWHRLDPAGPFPGDLLLLLAFAVTLLAAAGAAGLRVSERAAARRTGVAGAFAQE